MMERKMANLFDFQRFQQNPKLKNVIQDVEGRYAAVLDDDDLALVSAAGDGGFIPGENQSVMEPAAVGDMYMADQPGGILVHPGLDEGEA